MGIPPTRFKQYPHEFSGGMRQRIMIALALVLRAERSWSPTSRRRRSTCSSRPRSCGILADLRRNFDTALLLITHNLGIVAEACDRVAVMYAGRIVEQGDARDVFAEPAHPYTRELLRSTISLSTTGLHYIPGAPPDLVDPPPACRFHPRCPDAMQVCAEPRPGRDRAPERRSGSRAGCTGPRTRSRRAASEPLEREEIAVAEEA